MKALAPALLTRIESPQQGSSVGLVVMGEGDAPRPLLIHRISRDNAYQRQGGACLAELCCALACAPSKPRCARTALLPPRCCGQGRAAWRLHAAVPPSPVDPAPMLLLVLVLAQPAADTPSCAAAPGPFRVSCR